MDKKTSKLGIYFAGNRLNYYFSQFCLLGAQNGFRVVFLLDGDRQAIYSGNVEHAWTPDNRHLFLKLALKKGLDVVDMQPMFKRHWDQKHEHMDYPSPKRRIGSYYR